MMQLSLMQIASYAAVFIVSVVVISMFDNGE